MGFSLECPEGTKPADTVILVFCFVFFFFFEHNEMMGFKTT